MDGWIMEWDLAIENKTFPSFSIYFILGKEAKSGSAFLFRRWTLLVGRVPKLIYSYCKTCRATNVLQCTEDLFGDSIS